MDGHPKVYIVNDAYQHDYSKALRFGELISVTRGNVHVFKIPRLVWSIRDAMKDFTDLDYVLLSGSGILNFLVITEALSHCNSAVNILQFGAKTEDYVPGEIRKDFWPGLFNSQHGGDDGRKTDRMYGSKA